MRWDGADGDQHVVQKGETLYSIAFRYGKAPEDLARWNRLGDGSLIHPGQVLRLTPPSGSRSSQRSTAERSRPKPLPKLPDQPAPSWAWPTSGRINVEFGGKPGPGTGVLIDGRAGQPVTAAASGRVVYAGSGLIGYYHQAQRNLSQCLRIHAVAAGQRRTSNKSRPAHSDDGRGTGTEAATALRDQAQRQAGESAAVPADTIDPTRREGVARLTT